MIHQLYKVCVATLLTLCIELQSVVFCVIDLIKQWNNIVLITNHHNLTAVGVFTEIWTHVTSLYLLDIGFYVFFALRISPLIYFSDLIQNC